MGTTALGGRFATAALFALGFTGGKIGIEFLEDFVAGALDVDLEGLQHARGHAVAFAQQAEQDVLGADVAVIECLRFLAREREDFLHARSIRDITRHLGVGTGTDLLFHFDADGLQVEAELLQHIDRDTLAELDQAEEQVLRAHVIMIEAVRLFAAKASTCWARGVKLFMV